jgi:hypothetical protein
MKKKYYFVILFLILTIFFIISISSVNAKMYKILDSEGNIIRLTNNPVLSNKEKESGYTISPPPEIKQETLSKGNNYDFLNTNWGMSKEEVLKIEKTGFIEGNREGGNDLQYKGKVDGLDCYMSYFFVEGKLTSTSCHIYQFVADKSDRNIYGCYEKIKEYLIKKYGEIFKDTEFSTSWDTSITKVDLFLSIGNKDFDLLIDCKSKSEPELNPEPDNFLLSNVDLVDFNASFTPKGDFINVQGTLRNYGKEIIKDAQVNVKCENKKGKIILIKTVDCQPWSIVPGSEVYFNLQLENIERISNFKVYLFDKYLTTEYLKILMAKVEVVIWSSELSKAGDSIYFEKRGNVLTEKDGEYVFINGTIKNVGDGFMSETSIDIRGVDSMGRLLSTDSCDVNPQEIGQGQTASFKGILARGKGIDDYIIDVNWINPQENSSNHQEIELEQNVNKI